MTVTDPTRVELQNRLLVAASQPLRRILLWSLILLLVTVVAVVLILNRVLPLEEIDWGRVSRHAERSLAKNPWELVTFIIIVIATFAQFYYLVRARRIERLILTGSEIHFQTALPRMLQFLMPSWSAKWQEVSRASLEKRPGVRGPVAIQLVLQTYRGEKRVLRPFVWVDAKESERQGAGDSLRKIQSMSPAEVQQVILESPVLRFMRAHVSRLRAETTWDTMAAPFALGTNPRGLLCLMLFAALLAYAAADFILNKETYAAQPPYGFFAMIGLLVAVGAGRWLRQGKIPLAESAGLAIVLGLMCGVAAYPGLLRANQLTDTAGLRTYLYRLEANGSLKPVQDGPPTLAFPRYGDYWGSFGIGSVHEVRLRKGGLGFYQVDMAPINDAMRKYFREQR